jgi:hypothetical protein
MPRTVVEVSPGPSLPTTFSALISQPAKPTPSVMPPVALVEIETAAQLIPGPRGSAWYTGTGAPSSIPGQQIGDMYLDNATDHVWQLQSGGWVDTGTAIHGSPDTPADILAKLVTVDGAGSGLDADMLDGHDSIFFATQGGLDGETAARAAADNTLQTNITSEASARAAADTTLQTNINTEVTNRTNADAALQGQISAKLDSATAASTYAPIASPVFTGDPKAPTPATADNDTSVATTAFVKAQGYIGEAPNDGTQYVRKSLAWAPVSVPPGTAISDAPPASPQPGQMWFESDTGNLYIWFDDGTSQQWVQVNMLTPAGPPARQTFSPGAGSSSLVIPVPTGAKHCHIGGRVYGATTGLSPVIRMSLDGSTFLSGASDYAYGGSALYNGSSGSPTKIAAVSATFWPLGSYTDRVTEAMFLDVDIVTKKTAGNVFCYRSRMWSYHSATTALFQDILYAGYTGGATLLNATEIKALQLTCSGGTFAGAPDSVINVDWTY